MRVLVELVVDDRVEGLEADVSRELVRRRDDEQVVHQPRVALVSEQEIGRGERLEQLQEPRRRLHADILEIRRSIGNADSESREQGIQARSRGDRVDGLM